MGDTREIHVLRSANMERPMPAILTVGLSTPASTPRLQLMLDSCQQIHVVGRKPVFQPIAARLLLYPRSLGIAIFCRGVMFVTVSDKHCQCSIYVRYIIIGTEIENVMYVCM